MIFISQSKLSFYWEIKNFSRFINQNLKKLNSAVELPESISSYWATHSFATTAIRKGASKAFIGEALDHKNPKTTLGYVAGFEEKAKREMADNLMLFE